MFADFPRVAYKLVAYKKKYVYTYSSSIISQTHFFRNCHPLPTHSRLYDKEDN